MIHSSMPFPHTLARSDFNPIALVFFIIVGCLWIYVYAQMLRASFAFCIKFVWSDPEINSDWQILKAEAYAISVISAVMRAAVHAVPVLMVLASKSKQGLHETMNTVAVQLLLGVLCVLTDAIVIHRIVEIKFNKALVVSTFNAICTAAIIFIVALLVLAMSPLAREAFR